MFKQRDKRHILEMQTPASWWRNKWREALPSGNGKIGAAVYGGVKEETILLNHEALWEGAQTIEMPDVSYTLKQTRQLMDKKRYHEANEVLADELKRKQYNPDYPTPLPLGDLRVSMNIGTGFKDYSRRINMETGEVSVSWRDGEQIYERTLFVSRADDAVIYRIQADCGQVNATLWLNVHDPSDAQNPLPAKLSTQTLDTKSCDEYLYYALENDNGTDFGAVAKVIAIGGTLANEDEKILVKDADSILVITKIFVLGSRQREWERLKHEISAIQHEYEILLDSHIQLHAPLYHSASIELIDGQELDGTNEQLLLHAYKGEASAQLIEKMWAFGRYLFISSTREDGFPCPLYGLWCGDYRPIFSANVSNVNMEMIYWHAPSGGLGNHLKALIGYLNSMMDQFRDNAQKLFGTRGIYISAYSTPNFGIAFPVVPVILNWTGAAGWLAQHCYAYYQFTGDIELLRNSILPFMREAALFYEDFFLVGSDGMLLAYPSVSPENSPGNYQDAKADQLQHPMPTTINATMEFAIAKELLQNLIEGARAIGVYEDEVDKWEHMLQKIPPYQINEDGVFREWLHDEFTENYNHRHMSHLYPMFPGMEITNEQHPKWYAACAAAMHKRLSIGLSDQSGWSLAFLGNLYARLGDGEQAKDCIDLIARSCVMNNLLTVHNDWRDMGICLDFEPAPFQIDANMGVVSTVQEMLLFVSADLVKLLPALPRSWKQGRVKGLRFHTGNVEMQWDSDEGTFEATLYGERDTTITLKLPEKWSDWALQGVQVTINDAYIGKAYKRIVMKKGGKLFIKGRIHRE